MNPRHAAVAALLAAVALTSASQARAQEWSEAQLEVWDAIHAEWAAAMEKDRARFGTMFHESFEGWSAENPAPRDLEATAKWSRLEETTTLAYELHPLAIVVAGETAVAHYLWSDLSEDAGGERETTHGRYTDVLVRDGDRWKFLAWQGGADPEEDD